jgi:hypothetical protein
MSYSYSAIPTSGTTGICNKTSNNKYFDCAPIMNDGRAFTDYRPSGFVNAEIQIGNDIKNNQEYRQFLIQNAAHIMKLNDENAKMKNQCSPCDAQIPGSSVDCYYTPDARRCVPGSPSGIGITNQVKMNSWNILPYDPTIRHMSPTSL